MGMTNSDWKNLTSAHGKAVDRIRELEAELAEALEKSDRRIEEARDGEKRAIEKLVDLRRELVETKAELQVRDDMGNEVLRILREATGKRDFHSEMEAAEYAAEIIRASGWRPIAEAPELVDLLVGGWVGDEWDTDLQWKHSAIECGYTHYLPQPAPPAREVANDGE